MGQEKKKQIGRLFLRHYNGLYRRAYSFLREPETCRDIVSGVFARLCEDDSPLDEGRAEAFLFTSVRNACLNEIRNRGLHEKIMSLYPVDTFPEDFLSGAEDGLLSEIREFIDSGLPRRTGQIFKLCFYERKTYGEAAETAGVSRSAVNKHIVRALYLLRERFGKK